MSMSLVKQQIQINFAAPANLNEDTVFTDDDNASINSYTPKTPNIILDIVHDVDPVAGKLFTLYTRRPQKVYNQLGKSANFLTTFPGTVRPKFPIGLGSGFFQFVEQQTLGALTAQNYLVTLNQPLSL